MRFERFCFLYGVGSIAGALVVATLWLVSILLADNWSFLSFAPVVEDFYAPAIWGGVCALLYTLPLHIDWFIKGIVFSLVPAFIFLAHKFSWVHTLLFESVNLSYLMREESLLTFAVYAMVWGVFTSYSAYRIQ